MMLRPLLPFAFAAFLLPIAAYAQATPGVDTRAPADGKAPSATSMTTDRSAQ